MSFTASAQGTTFEAGWFLVDDEQCLRETATIAANHAQKVTRNGRTIVPAGAVIPANGATAVGILYEDIDVTDGAAPGSIVTKGTIYGDRLPAALESAAATALTGIKVKTSPAVVRPSVFGKFDALTVESEAGTAQGDTKLTVTGHTLETGESYVYKTNATTAPTVKLGDDLTGWTAWDGDDDITATTGHKITVAVKGADGTAVAAGSTTVTAKA
jgi:hypothetical protein